MSDALAASFTEGRAGETPGHSVLSTWVLVEKRREFQRLAASSGRRSASSLLAEVVDLILENPELILRQPLTR